MGLFKGKVFKAVAGIIKDRRDKNDGALMSDDLKEAGLMFAVSFVVYAFTGWKLDTDERADLKEQARHILTLL